MRLAVFICVVHCCLAQTDYQQGVALFQKGEFAAAIPYLTRATSAPSADAQAWKALGVAYAALSQYPQAEPALARACAMNPKLDDACYFQSRALYAMDRFEASLTALNDAPKTWKVRLAAGQALEALTRPAEAERELRAAVSLVRNTDSRPGVALGLFLLRQGRVDDAVEPLSAVAERFPASAEAHLYLGRARLERGEVAAAIPELERAVALDDTSAQAHLLLAKAYLRAGRADEAKPHFAEAAKRAQ